MKAIRRTHHVEGMGAFCVILLAGSLLFMPQAVAQQSDGTLEEAINNLRADLRADKIAILKEALQLSPEESEKFWPVFKEYDAKVTALNDQELQLFKEYARDFGSISENQAKTLALKAFSLQSERVELKKSFFYRFTQATSALTAAKFFQAEHRLELMYDLKLSSEMPSLLIQRDPKPH